MASTELVSSRRYRPIAAVLVLGAALVAGIAVCVAQLSAPASADPAEASVSAQDGVLPDGASIDDDHLPGIANLDPELFEALRQAVIAAQDDSVEISITSGWRSVRYQEELMAEAITEHGSAEAASAWVAPPGLSSHNTGDAVDIGPVEAMTWMSENGASFGLCRTYENEAWHFELRPEASSQGCPALYRDATEDPRLQR